MRKFARILCLCSLIFVLFWDNLRKWEAEGSTFFLFRYIFEPISFHQFGWGMYSFDITQVRSLRYKYELSNDTVRIIDSQYGHVPSFKRTLLGNLDMEISSNSARELIHYLAQYKCRNPDIKHSSVKAVTIQYIYRQVPRLYQRDLNDGKEIKTVNAVRTECRT